MKKAQLLQEARVLQGLCYQKLMDAGLPVAAELVSRTEVVISSKLGSCAGKAKYIQLDGYDGAVVELSFRHFAMAENRSEFQDTVLHEFAHVATGCSTADDPTGHGQTWRHICVTILGGSGATCHTMQSLRLRPRVICGDCGAVSKVLAKELKEWMAELVNGAKDARRWPMFACPRCWSLRNKVSEMSPSPNTLKTMIAARKSKIARETDG